MVIGEQGQVWYAPIGFRSLDDIRVRWHGSALCNGTKQTDDRLCRGGNTSIASIEPCVIVRFAATRGKHGGKKRKGKRKDGFDSPSIGVQQFHGTNSETGHWAGWKKPGKNREHRGHGVPPLLKFLTRRGACVRACVRACVSACVRV